MLQFLKQIRVWCRQLKYSVPFHLGILKKNIFFQCLPCALSLKMRIKLKSKSQLHKEWDFYNMYLTLHSRSHQNSELVLPRRPSLRNCDSWPHNFAHYIYFKNTAWFNSYYLITAHEQDPKQTAEFRKVCITTLKITGCSRWVWGTCVVVVHSSENAVGFTAPLNITTEMYWYENGISVSVEGEHSLLTFSPSFFAGFDFFAG